MYAAPVNTQAVLQGQAFEREVGSGSLLFICKRQSVDGFLPINGFLMPLP